MHIIHVITKADLGGAQNVAFNLIQSFSDKKNYQLTLITGEQGPLVENCKTLGIDVIVIDSLCRQISLLNDFKAYKQLKRIFKEKHPDIVQLHSSKAGIIGRIAAKSLAIRSIFTVHGWSFKRNPDTTSSKFFIFLEKVFAKFTDDIVVVSADDQNLANRYKIKSKNGITLIKNGVVDTKFLAKPDLSLNKKIIIVMVARFSEQKDQPTLLEAIKNIEGKFEVWLIGDGPNIEKIRTKVNVEKLGGTVTHIGPSQQVDKLLAQSHIGVLCSNWEGLPISIIEYMRAGLPIIASNVGGINELIKHDHNGYLVTAQDIDSVGIYLNKLISDSELRKKLGLKNRKDFTKHYSITYMIESYEQLYKRIK